MTTLSASLRLSSALGFARFSSANTCPRTPAVGRARAFSRSTMTCSTSSKTIVEVYCTDDAVQSKVHKGLAQVEEPSLLFTFEPADSGPTFRASQCQAHLKTKYLGRTMLVTPEIRSTQDFMRANTMLLGDGAVMVADRQTSGKGRGGNTWTSPDGCLMFTAAKTLRVNTPAQAPFINYLVCLAVLQGIMDALEPLLQGAAPPPIRIKWPNDIYAGALKIGGALIHTTWAGDRFNVITGVGLNVTNSQPTTCIQDLLNAALQAAGSSAAGVQAPSIVTREAVLAGVLNRLEQCYQVFETDGFNPLLPTYLASWLHSDQQLTFQDTDPGDPTAPPRTVRLTIKGLSPSGYLLAVDETGAPHELTPDGNSLDMMAGLIKRKI